MKKLIVFIFLAAIFSCKKKEPPTPMGYITFWSDDASPNCHPPSNRVIYVSMDGQSIGQISNFQSTAPSSCAQSNMLLVVSATQGVHSLTFTDNCNCNNCPSTWAWSATGTVHLTSDCYVFYVPHR
ncbi:MAG TPA: hypothetical protein VK835_06920 [Bacteroidia bacterium]|jgi:hypothetical protein|nr:hypothetical protein [Bacteroidia bacterium]